MDRQSKISRRKILTGAASLMVGGAFSSFNIAQASSNITPDTNSVLLVIDMQNCFLPGGTLAVKGGNDIIAVINTLGQKFKNVIFTQDWHTPNHASFASSHKGKKPFETVKLPYGEQVLWPDHCVQGTKDAELSADLDIPHAQMIIRKGYHNEVDSYSAFIAADQEKKTGLTGYLQERNLSKVYVCGLATDFCVSWSAIDAASASFDVSVIEDASRGIDLNGSIDKAWEKMKKSGIKRISSKDFS